MRYLIDTDWAIDHLHNVEKVVRKLDELAPEGLALSIISLAELYEGVYYSSDPSANKKALHKLLSGVSILDIGEEICEIFGRERGRLRKEGKIIGDLDLFIACTCLYHNLTLLTNNREHFERIGNLEIISV